MNYVRYSPEVEVKQPNEDEQTAQIVEMMTAANARAFDRHRHAIRDAHAKQHGTVVGELQVYPNLPEHLAQGLFATPATYPVVIRFSSAPGDIKDDRLPVPHGMAVKVIGVPGEKILPGQEEEVTQDFLLVSMPVIPFGTVKDYLEMQRVIALQETSPERAQQALAALARGTNRVLEFLGIDNPTVEGLAARNEHILGQTFHSMAALRYGDYIAKVSAAPLSPEVKALEGQIVDTRDRPSAMRDEVVDFFRQHGAEYELRAQLSVDLEKMPVEDGSVLWEEKLSPQQPVGKIVIPPQEAYSPARRVYSDDVLSFNPWHTIPEHRPLGSIMRVRIPAYEASTKFRHDMNMQPRVEPRDISEIPD